jgi:hypothetical protein
MVKGEAVEFAGVLLNPGDWFVLEVGVASRPGAPSIVAPSVRIAGVREIEFRVSTDSAAEPRTVPRWILGFQVLVVLLMSPLMFYQFRMMRRRLRGD